MRRDEGAALALVVWGLVVGGALLTVVTVLAVQEQRAAVALGRAERGLVGAEQVGAELISHLTVGTLRTRLPSAFDALPLDAGNEWDALVRRLTPGLFLLEVAPRVSAAGAATREGASVRLGWLLRPAPDSLVPAAAVSIGGRVALGDDVDINGSDEDPSGVAGCPSAGRPIAGVAAETVSVVGSASLMGNPPELLRPSGASGLSAGDLDTFRRLAERATLILAGGSYAIGPATVGTSCDLREPTNWGAPGESGAPCGSYVPIILVTGDLTLNGTVGQGILLVNGNLRVTAPLTFYGTVIVTGEVDITAPTEIRGILAAAELRSAGDPVTQLKVHYSKCILSNDLEISSSLRPLPSRAWSELFQAP